MKELLQMFWAFSKIGALTFGGGYAMLPIVQREIVETYGWVTDEEVLDYYALAQCSPGVIAVNTAAFIGYKKRGTLGAAVAALGVAFPSLIIILLIASFIAGFSAFRRGARFRRHPGGGGGADPQHHHETLEGKCHR
jgi:chromate transporter